ncbi:AAA family ATPase [Tunturiibacter psychrotolerans]|uniref:AAA family ATPase n=1 Tax=Tunturiibacter psychrotolerans TaxID=3069686 RepID=UPI003D1D5154
MKLIFLYGLPATGKLTVARELAAMTGYRLFHNHLTVDLLLSVFEFGSPAFVALREEIWLSVFDQAASGQVPGLIFTFAPEPTVQPGFLKNVAATVEKRGGEVDFVELVCPRSELRRRLGNPSRVEHRKLTSVKILIKFIRLESLMDIRCRSPGSRSTPVFVVPHMQPQR